MRILLIEDDFELCQSLAFQLEHEGIITDTCEDGADALYYINQNAYELILLDRMLPHINGLTLLKKMRNSGNHTPVILMTALGELHDKIAGLDAGADDYLVKPFDCEELMARIRCIIRRPRQWENTNILTFGDIRYSPEDNRLSGPLGNCTLSKKEGSLLEFFMRNTNQTLPRITILTRVWGPDSEVEDGNLDNYMHFIRRRLKSVSPTVSVKTVRCIGYHLEENHV